MVRSHLQVTTSINKVNKLAYYQHHYATWTYSHWYIKASLILIHRNHNKINHNSQRKF